MNYQQALDYIYSFINYEKTGLPALQGANYNLERMGFFLEKLDNPQEAYPSIVIAGTKGKGSTAAFCEAALRAAGYRVGLYTQPHLHTYRERIRINQQLISREELPLLLEGVIPAIDQTLARESRFGRLTTYEVGTGLALLYFARQAVEIAVLEIGLGGRLDAVNLVNPLVSVISSISLDHMGVLGNTLAEIAREKAGIIKPGIPVVSAPQRPEAEAVIRATARDRQAPLYQAEPALPVVEKGPPLPGPGHRVRTGQLFSLEKAGRIFETPLLGLHQLVNAAVAARAIGLQSRAAGGLAVNQDQLAAGFREVTWPGRLEVLEDQPGMPLLLADGAHNGESARRLVEALNPRNFYFKRLIFLVGTSNDKDISGIFRELVAAHPAAFILTRSHHPRSLDPASLEARVWPGGFENREEAQNFKVVKSGEVAEALEAARQLAGPEDLICATGSLFIVAEVREAAGRGQEKD